MEGLIFGILRYLKRAFFLPLAFNLLFCRLPKGINPTVN